MSKQSRRTRETPVEEAGGGKRKNKGTKKAPPEHKETEQSAVEVQRAAGESSVACDEGIAELEMKLEESNDKYLRTLADLDNFRKRTEREKADLLRSAGERLIGDLLEVLDGFDQALAMDAGTEAAGSFVEGMVLLRRQLMRILEKEGLTEIVSTGQPFDPNIHEAAMQVESAEHSSDTVVQELRKGYLLNERLLRPARVAVAK
ncbi:MAG: nucleotide exchange factor GrpE [Candidatus Eisenbacteria sp.]|nr:nucleotide exchange factor GrpE [Candidatus Eisenbacteria bacterium]